MAGADTVGNGRRPDRPSPEEAPLGTRSEHRLHGSSAPASVTGPVAPPGGGGPGHGATRAAATAGRRDLSDEELGVFLDLSSDVYGVFEPQKGLVWANPSVVGVLGYEPEELRHVDLDDLVHPEDLGEPTEDLEDFPRDGSMLTLEVRCRA